MKQKKCLAKACFFIILFLVSIISCEIGLGSAVDTEPPSITIESPKVDSVIRDVFAITGRWSDDGAISEVKATLKRTDGNTKEIEIAGEFSSDPILKETGTWKVLIDYKKENLVDGTYQATVSIKDKGRHETTQSTTFSIDNTPPILILSRPGTTISSTDFDSYGKKITLEGKATDDNNVGLIELSVYKDADCTGEPLTTVELKNVPLTVEQEVTENGEEKYEAIYRENDTEDKDSKGTANRYFKIKVYDDAERFPVDASEANEDDNKGNCADYYYTDDGLAKALEKAGKITNLYHIQNGTLTTSDTEILEGLANSVRTGKFSVNPKNNPTFIVNSRNAFNPAIYDDLDHVDFQVTSGNNYLEVEVSPGLDKKPIDVITVAVALYECNDKGEYTDESPKIYLVNSGTHTEAGSYSDVKITKSGTSYKFKTSKQIGKSNYPELNTGRYYRVIVEGKDVSGNEIICDDNYSFKLVANGEIIELSGHGVPDYISQNSAAWKGSHEKFFAELSWTGGEPPYYIYRGSLTDPVITVSEVDEDGNWTGKEEFTYSKLSGLGFPASISYRMKKAGDIVSTAAVINLRYDSSEPSISNIGFKGAYYKESDGKYYIKNTEDAKFEISGIATDDTGIESVSLEIPGVTITPIKNESRFKFENLNLSALTTEVEAVITATDLAGNQKPSSITIVPDTEGPYSVDEVDASLKNLRIRIGNSNNDDITPANDATHPAHNAAGGEVVWDNDKDKDVGGKYGNGTFGNTTSIQLRGDFEDAGSGLAKIYYRVFTTENLLPVKNQGETEEAYKTRIQPILNQLKESVLSDTTGMITPLETSETRRVFYNVERKKDAETGAYTTPAEPDDPYSGTQFSTTSKLKDGKEIYKFYKEVTSTFKDNITGLKEGNNYLVFVAEDNVGNQAVIASEVEFGGVVQTFVNYSINIDMTPPSDITNKTATGIIFTNGSDMPELWGTVSDKATGVTASGLKSFILYRDGSDTQIPATLREVKDSDPADIQTLAASDETLRIWEADVSDLLPTDSKTISISATATDSAGSGNSTPAVIATITIDKTAPTVTINAESPSDADSDTEDICEINGIISISGTSDDENGIDSVVGLYYKVYTGDAPSAPADNTVIPDSGNDGWYKVSANTSGATNWKITNINTAKLDGTTAIADNTKVCLTVAVKDKAGNIGYSVAKPVVVDQDSDRPKIHLSTLQLTYKDSENNDQKMDSQNPVWLNTSNLSGTVTDDDGSIVYVKIIAKEDADNSVPSDSDWETAQNCYRNGIWSTNFEDGFKKIYIQVKDQTGTVFTSNKLSTSSNTFGPKIEDLNSVKFGYNNVDSTVDDIIYVKVDTVPPYLTNIYYYTSNTLINDPQTTIADTDWTDAQLYIRTDKFGGKKKYLYLKYRAFDKNGINTITPVFSNATKKLTKSVPLPLGMENYKEEITCFDISPVASGLTKLEINLKDNAAASSQGAGVSEYFDVIIDNTEPEISFSNYTSGSQVYGSSAVTLRGTTSDTNSVVKVEYALSVISNGVPYNSPNPYSQWVDITDNNSPTHTSPLGWQIVFDGKTQDFTDPYSYHADLLKNALFSLYGVPTSHEETERIYIWVRATDELGNVGTNMLYENDEGFFLDVIPNGDRPAVEITYPSSNSSVGGAIRITGTTDIKDVSASVSEVYLQIDPSYDSAAGFNPDWADELQALINGKGVNYSIVDDPTATVNGSSQSFAAKIGKGIKAQGTSKLNWFLKINEKKELNLSDSNRKIAIRAYAISSTGKVSVSELCVCEIDPFAPVFGGTEPLRFVQYSDAGLTIESASRNYESGVYLKGQWYLVGSIEDDSGIRQITFDDKPTDSDSVFTIVGEDENENVFVDNCGWAAELSGSGKYKNFRLKIPIGNTTADDFGKIDYVISATDGSDSQAGNTLQFTIYYDNKAPDFEVSKGNGKDLVENGKIYQSNGAYTVQGSFAEPSEGQNNQSGFGRIAMFFTRERTVEGQKGLYILDSMIASGEQGISNFIKVADISNTGVETCINNVEKKDGLYWRKTTGTLENTNELTITEASLITDKTVRKGGICMVDNVIYRISRISGTKITLEGTLTEFSTAKPVYFAYAQIIDNLSQESGSTVVYTNNDVITNGDGDCMIEGVQFAGGEYNWNASLDSSNMFDGNVTMSFVAYDAAGNYTPASIAQKISNNAPRIAGVIFGTDTNLNGKVDDTELIESFSGVFTGITNVRDGMEYNGQDENGNIITSYEVPVTLNVKGALKVKPMIVGGNTALGWQYTYINKSDEEKSTTPTAYAGVGHSYDGTVRTDDLTINILLKDFLQKQIKEGTQNLKFTIWDQTDGSTLGNEATGSAKAEITLPVNIIIADSVNPTAIVYPFFWKSRNENSVYQNNPKNGHIELENELPSGFTTNGSGTLDRDAKVSGMITFDGVASDNVIVDKIKIAIPGYNSGNEFVIAERDSSAADTDGWTSTNLYYKKGEVVKANASLTGDSAKPWVFELISDVYDENGKNVITFRFHFNTETISTTALTNASVKFTAMDKGSPTLVDDNTDPDGDGTNKKVSYSNARSSTPGTTSTTTEAPTGCYKVDVVPYVTTIVTNLSALKKNNPSVYARTAKGHYGVSSSEILNIEGFNIAGATLKFEKTGGGNVTASYNANAGGEGIGGYAIPSTAKSGNMSVVVNTIESLNNSNNNDAKGSYAGINSSDTGDKSVYDNFYNRQPNGDNNNLLTDDIVLDVWQINSNAVVPISGVTSQPVMAINPTNHDIGFAFVNGALYYSMPNGSTYSYDNFIGGFDYWTSVTMAYDSLGNSYGVAAGGDINEKKADQFRMMTSRWGYADRHAGGYNTATNNIRLELIGQYDYMYNGTSYEGFRNFDKERIRSPSLATGSATSASTKVYLAYYDAINDEIRFKRGDIKTSKSATWNDLTDEDKAASFFGDYYGADKTNAESPDKVLDNGNDYSKYRLVHNSWIAGQTSRVYNTNGNTRNAQVITTAGNPVYAGQYVSIAAISGGGTNGDDAVVAVWWDGTNNQLLYSYNLTPNSIEVGEYKQEDTGWSTPVPIFDSSIGEYCKLAVIKEGTGNSAHYSVHIVGYDGLNCDVWYAYLPNFNSTANKKTCLVDSYGLIGTELNIDVALDSSGNPIPYISYYAGSCAHPKTAHWAGTTHIASTTTLNSVDDYERFTGVWEVSVIPTQSRVSVDHINIGVWKDSSGTITWSTTDGAAPADDNSNIGETKLDYKQVFATGGNTGYKTGGHVWGNGTKNPVLGYSITKGAGGYIETAQMK